MLLEDKVNVMTEKFLEEEQPIKVKNAVAALFAAIGEVREMLEKEPFSQREKDNLNALLGITAFIAASEIYALKFSMNDDKAGYDRFKNEVNDIVRDRGHEA